MTASVTASAIGHGDHRFPLAIVDHQASGLLELRWQDGVVSRLPHGLLRACCRCAACEQQRRASREPAAVDAALRLAAIHPVGDKGLNLRFSDGHGRGIYPWAYLRRIADGRSETRDGDVPAAIAGGARLAHA